MMRVMDMAAAKGQQIKNYEFEAMTQKQNPANQYPFEHKITQILQARGGGAVSMQMKSNVPS